VPFIVKWFIRQISTEEKEVEIQVFHHFAYRKTYIFLNSEMSIRVLITDDHQIILESLSLLIGGIAGMEVVGTLADSRMVPAFLELQEVDVLVTDFNMPHLTGIDLTLLVRARHLGVHILMLTISEDRETIRGAFQAGITGYVMKKASKAELERALKTVATGTRYFGDEVMREFMSATSEPEEALNENQAAITSRELEIIKLIAEELSTNQIADRLSISSGTVETHRHNIFRKLKVKNSIGVIKYAIRHQLI
jgi:DNA-binding NarL/FixJ family response regulator